MLNYQALQALIARNNPEEMVEAVLDLKSLTEQARVDLFVLAAGVGNYFIVSEFLESDINVKAANSQGVTAITVAIRAKLWDMAAVLIDHGVCLQTVVDEKPLLDWLKDEGQIELADYFAKETALLKKVRSDVSKDYETLLRESKVEEFRFAAIEVLYRAVARARVHDADSINDARRFCIQIENNNAELYRLANEDSFPIKIISKLEDEIKFSYILFSEFPYNPSILYIYHKRLTTFLEAIKNSFPSQIEKPLFKFINSTSNKKLSAFTNGESTQDWLIHAIRALKEDPKQPFETSDGECFGFSFMNALAMVILEMDVCEKRVDLIKRTPTNELKQKIQANRQEIIRKRQENKEEKLNADELEMIEVEAYLTGVAFAQNKALQQKVGIHPANERAIASVLLSEKLESKEAEGLAILGPRTKHYRFIQFMIYLQVLREVFKKIHPKGYVALMLGGNEHGVLLGFNPAKEEWKYCDANRKKPIQTLRSIWLIAENVFRGIGYDHERNILELATEFYSTENQAHTFAKSVDALHNHPLVKHIYAKPEQEKLQKKIRQSIDSSHQFSFGAAILSGKPALVQHFLNEKPPEFTRSLLQIALPDCVDHETLAVMDLLLEHFPHLQKIEVNALYVSILEKGKIDFFEAFLRHKNKGIMEWIAQHAVLSRVKPFDDAMIRESFFVCCSRVILDITQLNDMPLAIAKELMTKAYFQEKLAPQFYRGDLGKKVLSLNPLLRQDFIEALILSLEDYLITEVLEKLIRVLVEHGYQQKIIRLFDSTSFELQSYLVDLHIETILSGENLLKFLSEPACEPYLSIWLTNIEELNRLFQGQTEEVVAGIMRLEAIRALLPNLLRGFNVDDIASLNVWGHYLESEWQSQIVQHCLFELMSEVEYFQTNEGRKLPPILGLALHAIRQDDLSLVLDLAVEWGLQKEVRQLFKGRRPIPAFWRHSLFQLSPATGEPDFAELPPLNNSRRYK